MKPGDIVFHADITGWLKAGRIRQRQLLWKLLSSVQVFQSMESWNRCIDVYWVYPGTLSLATGSSLPIGRMRTIPLAQLDKTRYSGFHSFL